MFSFSVIKFDFGSTFGIFLITNHIKINITTSFIVFDSNEISPSCFGITISTKDRYTFNFPIAKLDVGFMISSHDMVIQSVFELMIHSPPSGLMLPSSRIIYYNVRLRLVLAFIDVILSFFLHHRFLQQSRANNCFNITIAAKDS
ncbi:hypothetical protein DSO57_1006657 [Entomophthora muscae]|uniref:Uncharacterized protein n=1 Tax=Entomophthora muscae TaxID=34485 RepID=A0ACC2SWF7_9FUNG|nr:hypothetical protein DSO57_1006657 [Entomophthora muscae]